MSSILINPQYTPEDKDIVDFVRSTSVALAELTNFLRKRGVYVSEEATKEDLADLIAKETFVWQDVSELLALITEPLKKESHITGKHYTDGDAELIEEAIRSVKTFRLNKHGDKITLESAGDGSYRVNIEYVDTFYEKTRLIQVVERDAEIIIHKTAYGFKTVRSFDETAKKVELAILGEFERLAKENDQKLETKRILLRQLPSVESKVAFFRGLMEGLPGFYFEQIKSVRVQSVHDEDKIADTEEGDEVAKEYAAAIESLVIKGRNIGETDLYDQYIGKDFAPVAATWMVRSDADDYGRVEVKAAFTVEAHEAELSYSVSAVWRRSDGDDVVKEKPSKLVSARFAELLSETAERALDDATKEPDAEPSK